MNPGEKTLYDQEDLDPDLAHLCEIVNQRLKFAGLRGQLSNETAKYQQPFRNKAAELDKQALLARNEQEVIIQRLNTRFFELNRYVWIGFFIGVVLGGLLGWLVCPLIF